MLAAKSDELLYNIRILNPKSMIDDMINGKSRHEEPVKWKIFTENIYLQSLSQVSANDIYRYIYNVFSPKLTKWTTMTQPN